MGISQVNYNGNTLIDLTADTVTAETLLEGVTAHDAAGEEITGTYSAASGVSITQIWENAAPTTAFSGGQQVDFDDDYDLFMVVYLRDVTESSAFLFTHLIKPGGGYVAIGVQSKKIIYRASLTITTSSIYFTSGAVQSSYGSETTNNNLMVPLYIYGIKFAQNSEV